MNKVGILGGSFNPIHMGHLILAEQACEQLGLDKVLFMPLKNPPHKPNDIIASDLHRNQMILNAIHANDKFELSTLELERDGITYTVDTLAYFNETYPQNEYYFIVGADSLFQMETWKEVQRVFSLANIIAASRYHLTEEVMKEQMGNLINKYAAKIHLLANPTIELSSKSIREKVEKGQSIRYYVPDGVREYIIEKRLYCSNL